MAKKKNKPLETKEVKLEIERTDAMFLRESVASGEVVASSLGDALNGDRPSKHKFTVDNIIPCGVLVTVDKEQYLFTVEVLVKAAVEFHKERDCTKVGRFAKVKGKG